MNFSKPEAFVKQIIIYLVQKEYDLAFALSKEFVVTFPNNLLAHFFLAKSAFWIRNFVIAIDEGRKAFNMSVGNDLITTGVLLASAYYIYGDFQKGYLVLVAVENALPNELTPEFEEIISIYSLALNNPENAEKHIKRLYELNSKYAESFILKFLEFG